jgi:phosphoribosylanthranilate isomerase
MIIKVCGLTDNESGRQVAALPGIDYLGFIFYEGSKRYTETTFATAKKKVGVFVNAPINYVLGQIEKYGLDAVQLHGDESPEYIIRLPKEVEIIKAIGVATADDLESAHIYHGVVSFLIFDTKCKAFGGSGVQYDWQILENYKGETPFLLSGGIGPDSVDALKKFRHPKLAGYDLNSRFEIEPKIKDVAKLAAFLKEIKL